MGAENVFRKVFGRKVMGEVFAPRGGEVETLDPALKAELQQLDLLRDGLGRKAIHYVTTGERGDLFARLLALSTAGYDAWKAYEAAEPRPYTLAMATAKAVVTGAIPPGPVVLRTLEVRLAATRQQASWSYTPRPQPTVLTALAEMLNGGLSCIQVQYKVDWSKAISVETALAHFQVCGGGLANLFEFLLNRSESTQLASYPGCWAASETCIGYFRSHPAALAEALRRVGSNSRAGALRLIEHLCLAEMPEIEAQVVAMFTKPFTKDDRERAISTIARFDPAHLAGILERHMATGDADTRHALVEAAGRAVTPDIIALLKARAPIEKTARVQAAIAAVLEVEAGCITSSESPSDGGRESTSYVAATGDTITLPSRCDLGSDVIPAPSDAVCIGFVALVEQLEERRRQSVIDHNARYANANREPSPAPVPYARAEIEAAFANLTQAERLPANEPGAGSWHPATALARSVRHYPEGQAWLRQVLEPLPLAARLRILRHSGFSDDWALIGLGYAHSAAEVFGVDLLCEWLAAGELDLRDLAGGDQLRQLLARNASSYGRDSTLDRLEALPADAVWPWLAENMDVFDEALGLRPATTLIPLSRALTALAALPAVPQRYLPRLTEIAVAEKRALRLQAMELLREAKGLPVRIEALLDDKRQAVRVNAAGWLADLRSTKSEKTLRARLKKEKSDPVRAALIVALQRLGADLADVIGPASLIAEADKANGKAAPKLPEWLVANRLPQVRFKDGTSVPQAVVEYWLALAIRLKDPGAHGQFGIYLDQLLPEDARTLSGWVLESWIAYDTATATLEEATAYAKANFLGHYAVYQGRYLQGADMPPEAQAALIAQITRQKMGEMLNSGSDTKGLLALACRADPVWAAGRVRWFLKKHGRRSNQAMALLEALAGTGAPVALQVVIAASARLKQKSTQARAAEIAQRYADDRGWSIDELADRTVPSAGFDDDGELDLPCGEDAKPYIARLDADLAIHLFNPDGKVVKALPAGDDDNTKESKKAFTAARKELAQVIELQATRLFEAMCVERQWPVADWRLAFHQHPVMRRLIERLVWQGLDADGQPLGLFRPTQEGDFTDAADNDVAIDDFAAVRLAHGALVDAETCAAWTQHLKDYEVKPFLAQFDTLRAPLTPELAEAEAITDRQGWAADSRTFRGAAEKRGYQRVMRDNGGCHEYVKEFASHGITATIWHSGSYAVDENLPQALTELKFTKAGHRGTYRLKDVPPVLLAECWADYHAVAAKGAFDPAWEKISPW